MSACHPHPPRWHRAAWSLVATACSGRSAVPRPPCGRRTTTSWPGRSPSASLPTTGYGRGPRRRPAGRGGPAPHADPRLRRGRRAQPAPGRPRVGGRRAARRRGGRRAAVARPGHGRHRRGRRGPRAPPPTSASTTAGCTPVTSCSRRTATYGSPTRRPQQPWPGAPAGGRRRRRTGPRLPALLRGDRALAGSWARDLPQAPTDDGRLCSPRQVRAGVPRDVDRLIDGLPAVGSDDPRLSRRGRRPADHAAPRRRADPAAPGHRRARAAATRRSPGCRSPSVAASLSCWSSTSVAVALTGGSGSGVPFPDLLLATTTPPPRGPHTSAARQRQPRSASGPADAATAGLGHLLRPAPGRRVREPVRDATTPSTATRRRRGTPRPTAGPTSAASRRGSGCSSTPEQPSRPRQVEVDFVAPGATYEIRAADTAASPSTVSPSRAPATPPRRSSTGRDHRPRAPPVLAGLADQAASGSDGFKVGIATFGLKH